MNKKEIIKDSTTHPTAFIHGLSHDGRGIATIANKTTFIAGALPQETVTYHITQKRSQFSEGETVSIIEPSSQRATPPCPHFGLCGGCSLQHMQLEMQALLKQQTLLDQLKHFGKVIPAEVAPPLQAATLGYRRKARVGVKFVTKKNKLLIGFREKSSRYLADLTGCAVLHPLVGNRFEELRQLIMSLSCYQHIPQIEIAMGDQEVALVFRHMVPLTPDDQTLLAEFGQAFGVHIYLQPNPPHRVHKLWPHDSIERITYTLPDESLSFLFHPLDFTQVNLDMNRMMVAQAMNWLDLKQDDLALDLFCGIGNFTLPMAKRVTHVTGIEGGEDMVARAYENAKLNHLSNVEFHACNLEQPPSNAPWAKQSYDKILLDPPRVGAKNILPLIATFSPQRIVYVSCNPATLARDAGELVHTYKYRLQKVGIMNMFAHTSHIEAMALFEKELD